MALDWLITLPLWPQTLLATIGPGLFSLAVTAALRRITATRRRGAHNEVLGLVFATCGVVYAVLLAFVVYAVYTQYLHADGVTTQEAATLIALYYDTERYPAPTRSAMQESIRGYTRSVVDDEFPQMERGEASPVTRRWTNRMYRLTAGLQPGNPYSVQLDSRAVQELDSIVLLRGERLEASRTTLPWTFWLAMLVGGAATLVLGALLFMEHKLHQLLASFLLGMVIGTVLFLVVSIDRPFTGTTAVGPASFQRALQLYSQIDALNR